MDPIVFLKPPKIDPAVWRPDVPLVVIERCLTSGRADDDKKVDPSKLICTWLAIRWLMAAFPKRRGFPTRLIAERAGAHMTYITAWCKKLIALGLLEKVGEEPLPRNLTRSTKHAEPQPIYSIPLAELERVSHDICLEILAKCGGASESEKQPDEQMAFDLPLPDAPQKSVSDRISDQGSDRIDDRVSDRISDQGSDRISDQGSDRISDHGEGGTDHGREGDRARARKKSPGRPKSAPPVPPAPPGAPPLPKHPLVLWADACTTPRAIDGEQLALLAAEHDEPTQGHGLYWVGRAILCAAADEDVRSIRKLKKILARWRDEASYGSDLYQETTNGRQTAADHSKRSANGAGRRTHGERLRRAERPGADGGAAAGGDADAASYAALLANAPPLDLDLDADL